MLRAIKQSNLCHAFNKNKNCTLSLVSLLNDNQRVPLLPHSQRHASTTTTTGATTEAAANTASSSAADPSMYIGIWKFLSDSTPVAYMQQGLTQIHDFTGLPWWATIVLSTVLFRSCITLPLAIYQFKVTARLERLMLEFPPIVEELKREAAMAMRKFDWTEQHTRLVYRRSLRKQWNNLIVRDNCHPAKTLIVLWGQIPLWIFQSMAIRNFVYMLPDPSAFQAQIIFAEMTVGGFGWIPNLTEVDSSYILPVALGLINLSIIEIQASLRTRQSSRLQRYATNAFRGLSLLMVPIACTVPSALCLYWVTSSTYGLAQNLLLVSPIVRRAVGIPQTKSELSNPYEHLWNTLKVRTGQMPAPAPPTTNEQPEKSEESEAKSETTSKNKKSSP